MSTDDDKLAELGGLLDDNKRCTAEELELAVTAVRSLNDEDERAWQTYKVTRRLASIGQWEKAEALAQSIDDACPYEKAIALRVVAWQLVSGKLTEWATRLLREAVEVARMVDGHWQKAEQLCRAANTVARAGESEQAFSLWEEAIKVAQAGEASPDIQDRIDSASVLWEIAESMALAGYFEAAVAIAVSIRTEVKKNHALEGIERIRRGGPPSQFYDPESS